MAKLSDFELRTLPGLWRWHDQNHREFAFQARSLVDGLAWQTKLRETLTHLLGGFPTQRCPLDPHLVEVVQDDGFARELWVIQTQPGEYMSCYVLVPPRVERPYRPVVALHGHGTWGAAPIVGLAPETAQKDFIQQLNYDYARQLARRGFLVFAPTLRGFGERMEEPALRDGDNTSAWQDSCHSAGAIALLCGKTLLGLRIWDIMKLADYIATRPEAMTQTLGCVGLSGGGMVALFATALEPRFTCTVVSGYLNTFRDSIMALRHCLCNYVPGLAQYAEMCDLAGLIAPRPMLIEAGTQDPIFPVAAARQALQHLRGIYRCFDADDRLAEDIFDGGHAWSGAQAYAWLDRWL